MTIKVKELLIQAKAIISENKIFVTVLLIVQAIAICLPEILGIKILALILVPIVAVISIYPYYLLAAKKKMSWNKELISTLASKIKTNYFRLLIALFLKWLLMFVINILAFLIIVSVSTFIVMLINNGIMNILVVMGFILFVPLLIMITIRIFFVSYFILIMNSTIKNSFKSSWRMTKNNVGKILLLMLIPLGIILAAGLSFLILLIPMSNILATTLMIVLGLGILVLTLFLIVMMSMTFMLLFKQLVIDFKEQNDQQK